MPILACLALRDGRSGLLRARQAIDNLDLIPEAPAQRGLEGCMHQSSRPGTDYSLGSWQDVGAATKIAA
jgi:hypothetical protein